VNVVALPASSTTPAFTDCTVDRRIRQRGIGLQRGADVLLDLIIGRLGSAAPRQQRDLDFGGYPGIGSLHNLVPPALEEPDGEGDSRSPVVLAMLEYRDGRLRAELRLVCDLFPGLLDRSGRTIDFCPREALVGQ